MLSSTLAKKSTMKVPWPKLKKKLLEERLQKGQESATQLQTLLQKPLENHGSISAAELAVQILRSFTDSLSVLGLNEISQIVTADGETGDCPIYRSSKTTAGQRKKPAGVKDRRGSYRRRNVSDTWIKLSSNMDDEYAWRKYGQKQILNSKFPRCYFRCTHRSDQGCKATKQVQRVKQDPLVYQTTYFGHHTCKTDMLRVPKIIQETDPMEDSCLLSFETKIPSNQKVSVIMQQDDTHSDVCDNKSLLDSTIWQDLMASGSSSAGPAKVMMPSSSETGSAHLEEVVSSTVYSCLSNTMHGLDMEDFSKFADLDDKNLYDFQESDLFHQASY